MIGIHMALQTMKVKEESWVEICTRYQQMYTVQGQVDPLLAKPEEKLYAKIKLLDFRNPLKPHSELTFEERANNYLKSKTEGSKLFK